MSNHTIKYTIASVTAACTLLGSASVWAQAPSFTDIPSNHWAQQNGAISWGTEKHIISGYGDGTFQPNRTVTEAEFLRMLISLYLPTLDPNGTDWTAPYYEQAKTLRYPLAGLDQASSRHSAITRTKVAEVIAAADGVHYTGDDAIHYVLGKKLAFGKVPGVTSIETYRGSDPLTRAEAVQFLKTAWQQGLTQGKARPEQPSDRAQLPPLPVSEQNRPLTKESTIMLEGMPEKITLHLFNERNWPFTTYYPSDMVTEAAWVPEFQKYWMSGAGTIPASLFMYSTIRKAIKKVSLSPGRPSLLLSSSFFLRLPKTLATHFRPPDPIRFRIVKSSALPTFPIHLAGTAPHKFLNNVSGFILTEQCKNFGRVDRIIKSVVLLANPRQTKQLHRISQGKLLMVGLWAVPFDVRLQIDVPVYPLILDLMHFTIPNQSKLI